MRHTIWKTTSAFLIPGGPIFLAAIGFLRPHGLPAWFQQPVAALPYIVLVFGLVFGWYFASSRMILSLLVLALADRANILLPASGADPTLARHTVFAITAFLVPVNLLAFSILKEDAISTVRGIARLMLVLTQPFLLLWLCLPEQQELARSFTQTFVPLAGANWTVLPQPALFAFATAVALQSVRFALHRDPLEGGSIWALVAVFLAYHGTQYGWQPTNFFTIAGLILFVTLIQASYQRTYRDELTGIPGRLAYEEASSRLRTGYSVAIIGIDKLKQHTNAHGKSVGEQILKVIAPKIQAACTGGQVFRISGEELTLLFPGTSAVETLGPLEQMRKIVETTMLCLRGRERVWEDTRGTRKVGTRDCELPVTLSIGVAEHTGDTSSLSLVTKSAYRALYEAKGAGGNVIRRGFAGAQPTRRSFSGAGRIVASEEF
jgi:diguanylate cyclase (GGDEF)-like protein